MNKTILEECLYQNIENKKAEVLSDGDNFVIKFLESNRYYCIDDMGNVSEPVIMQIDQNVGDLTKGGQCDGTKEKPYKITCIEDLVVLSIMVNGGNQELGISSNQFKDEYIELTRTIDFNSIFSYNDYQSKKYGDLNCDGIVEGIKIELTKQDDVCRGFTPIGESYSGNHFEGIFDGKYNEIRNIYEYATESYNLGLFGVVANSTIQNIKITGIIDINQENTSINTSGAAGVVGLAFWGVVNIINCENYVDVSASGNGTAGIVGKSWTDCYIINCGNNGNITGLRGEGIGGIGGRMESNTYIYNCYNKGDINSISSRMAGGIVGYYCGGQDKKINIFNVFNSGKVQKAALGSGGILATHTGGGKLKIKNAINVGIVDEGNLPGIIGAFRNQQPSELDVDNCFYLKNSCSSGIINEEDSLYNINIIQQLNYSNIQNILNNYLETNPDSLEIDEFKRWKALDNNIIFE